MRTSRTLPGDDEANPNGLWSLMKSRPQGDRLRSQISFRSFIDVQHSTLPGLIPTLNRETHTAYSRAVRNFYECGFLAEIVRDSADPTVREGRSRIASRWSLYQVFWMR